MKKQSVPLSVLCMLALVTIARGDAVRYTFEGTIRAIETYTNESYLPDGAILAPDEAFGHSLNTVFTYEFLVDTDLPATDPLQPSGTSTFWDGNSLYPNTWTAEYFYSEFLGDALIEEATAGSLTQQRGSTAEFITPKTGGLIDTSLITSLAAMNDASLLTVYNNLDSIGAWGVDTLVQGVESYFVQDVNTGYYVGTTIYSDMRITAIEPLATSVPEPSTGLLLMCSLTFVVSGGVVRRRIIAKRR